MNYPFLVIVVGNLIWFYFVVEAYFHVRTGKGWTIIFAPITVFMSSIFEEEGDKYRKKALVTQILMWAIAPFLVIYMG